MLGFWVLGVEVVGGVGVGVLIGSRFIVVDYRVTFDLAGMRPNTA